MFLDVQNYLGNLSKSTLITFDSLRRFCVRQVYKIHPGYLLPCRISRNESRLSRTCLRLSAVQKASWDERACPFRQPCKTGLTSCTGDGNSCKFNCCRGNTPCKRLTQVLTCPRYKDYRVKDQSHGLCFIKNCISWGCNKPLVKFLLLFFV